jgi:hypothetical protein
MIPPTNMIRRTEAPLIVSTDEAREGVTGHGVRYVLGISLAAVVGIFAVLLMTGPWGA